MKQVVSFHSTLTHHISSRVRSPISHTVHSGTVTCFYAFSDIPNFICGRQELETQIISEVKVKKIAIEDEVQMHGIASGTHAHIAYYHVEKQKGLLLVFVRAE